MEFWLIVAVIMLVIAVWGLIGWLRLRKLVKRCTVEVRANCTSIDLKASLGFRKKNGSYQYTYDHKEYLGNNDVYAVSFNVAEGMSCMIKIDPNDPEVLADPLVFESYRRCMAMFLSGLLVCAFCVYMYLKGIGILG